MKTLGPVGMEAFERRAIDPETAARFAISIGDLRLRFEYDPDTGRILWKSGPRKGREAGTLDRLGYRRLFVDGRQVSAGPVCWALATGKWPDGEIDHINRNKQDYRFANLRDVTRSENLRNRCYAKSGSKGVYWCAKSHKWRAAVRDGRRTVHLGMFPTIEGASAAYLAARGGEL